MCILDLSKVLMYEFHYDYIKNKYDKNQDYYLLIKKMKIFMTENVYEDFSKDKEMFDFSNFSAKSKCYDNSNSLVVSK